MNEKDTFDALMKLAEFRRQYRESRRATEWRGTFAVWTLLIGVATIFKSNFNFYSVKFLIVVALILAIIILHWWWVIHNFYKLEDDAVKMWDDYDKARTVGLGDRNKGPNQPRKWYRHTPVLIAITITIIFGLVVLLIVQLPKSLLR